MWIIGPSIARDAAANARQRPGGLSLGMQDRGVDIWWQGYGGLTLAAIIKKIEYLTKFGNYPDAIIIHCGANDIGQTPMHTLIQLVKDLVGFLSSTFPTCKIGWSQLLPRIEWRYSENVNAMEKCKDRLNRAGFKEVCKAGGFMIKHPEFRSKSAELYAKDGVHLSDLGYYLFLNNIQAGIEANIGAD